MFLPRYETTGGKIPAMERAIRDIIAYLNKTRITGDGKTIAVNEIGGGVVISAKRENVVGQTVQQESTPADFDFNKTAPRGTINVCSVINSSTTDNCFKTASYYPSITDSSIYVGMTDFYVNLNGYITEMTRSNVSTDTEVQSNSYYNAYTQIGVDNIMALWKVSDFIKDSAPSGGILPAISNVKDRVTSINGMLRIKAKLKSYTDDAGYNPIVFKWELHPNFTIESVTWGDKQVADSLNGRAYYRSSRIAYDQFSWYIPVARFSLTNCIRFITDLVDNGSSTSSFSFAMQQIDFNPTLMLTMSQAQYSQILAAQELINQ